MRVISIKEPYASLIMHKYKQIETRSWKTNYRGEIYIHASKSAVTNELLNDEVKRLTSSITLNHGHIICKAQLVDCIYMDDKFVENIKQHHQEYSCGRYEVGRYAWILTNIEPISPIKAKGKLNIWYYEINN